MKTVTKRTSRKIVVGGRDLDGYEEFLHSLLENFAQYDGPLFTTNATGLWDAFISHIPAGARQHYTCRTCMTFIERFGGLVRIDEKGKKVSAIWGGAEVPDFFAPAVKAVLSLINKSEINGIFVSSKVAYGTPTTPDHKGRPDWSHFHVLPGRAQIWNSRGITDFQRQAELLQDTEMLLSALEEYAPETVQTALALLRSESLYRSERVLGVAEWFAAVQDVYLHKKGEIRSNLIWYAVATAPAGFCHVKSSMIGTLLDDIAAGYEYADVAARFAAKMNPTQYQRAQVAPSAGTIDQAERLFEKMGLEPALARRYASPSELPEQAFIWWPVAPKAQKRRAGIFSHVQARSVEEESVEAVGMIAKAITWDRFQRVVLPIANKIWAYVSSDTDRFAALVTAAQDAPPILQWDNDENRNPFSWYYASGVDAEMRRRVLEAGGRYDDNDIRVTLAWENRNDLDLHVMGPDGHIFYGNKRIGNGWLDIDRNVHGETMTPIENTRWATGLAPEGRYHVFVNLYRAHHGFPNATEFQVELDLFGHVYTYQGRTRYENSSNTLSYMVPIVEFDYRRGVLSPINLPSASVGANAWNVEENSFVPVTAIVSSPNLWTVVAPHHGEHAFFLLEGCQDLQQGVGRGFFTESLKSELRPVRSVLEAYNAQAEIQHIDGEEAAGIGISKAGTGDLIVRVESDGMTALYQLDRWE